MYTYIYINIHTGNHGQRCATALHSGQQSRVKRRHHAAQRRFALRHQLRLSHSKLRRRPRRLHHVHTNRRRHTCINAVTVDIPAATANFNHRGRRDHAGPRRQHGKADHHGQRRCVCLARIPGSLQPGDCRHFSEPGANSRWRHHGHWRDWNSRHIDKHCNVCFRGKYQCTDIRRGVLERLGDAAGQVSGIEEPSRSVVVYVWDQCCDECRPFCGCEEHQGCCAVVFG
jgi:hypothetical protein